MCEVVEVRCPVGHRRLFTKLHLGQESYRYVHPDNLMEVSCGDCAGRLQRERGGSRPVVLHRYNFLGELVQTLVQYQP